MGFFQKAGLNVELTTMNNGSAISAAVAAGAIDIGISTPVQLANAVTRGVPFVLIAPGALSNAQSPAGLVCVSPGSTIRTAKDLEGKAVAVSSLKSGQELALDAWLTRNGADYTKVHTIETVISDMGPAVERGTVAAAVISDPALTSALRTHSVRAIGDPFAAVSPEFLISGWFSTVTFVEENADAVKRFRSAIQQAGNWANSHHSESAVILSKYAKMDVDVIRGMNRALFANALRPADIQPQLDAGLQFGILTKPVAAADLIGR
jgi:NitT/TauT family transport system substrate-binding protein